MPILKSFLYKIKTSSDYRLPFLALMIFSLFFMIASWILEFAFHHHPSPLSILQRYLLPLIALNALLGFRSQFKTSYVITCQLLVLTIFVISIIHTLIQFGLIHGLCVSEECALSWERASNFHIYNIPLSLFKSLGAIGIFILFLRNKK